MTRKKAVASIAACRLFATLVPLSLEVFPKLLALAESWQRLE